MRNLITPNLTDEEQEDFLRNQIIKEKWLEIQLSLLKALTELEEIKRKNGNGGYNG